MTREITIGDLPASLLFVPPRMEWDGLRYRFWNNRPRGRRRGWYGPRAYLIPWWPV